MVYVHSMATVDADGIEGIEQKDNPPVCKVSYYSNEDRTKE